MDLAGASIVLVLMSPIMLLISIYIRRVVGGPAIFRQKRVGQGGRLFTMYKFKTMYDGANSARHADYIRELLSTKVPMKKLDEELQIIPFGHFLRRTHLDELPQLINVLRGEMSLVGPRPDVPYAVENYAQWYCSRHDVSPGMTGLWQVRGKNARTYEEMIRLDIQYVAKRSILLDLMIMTMTVPTIAIQTFSKIRGARVN